MKTNTSILKESDIERFLAEDIGRGDVTTNSIIDSQLRAKGSYVAKTDFILAGMSEALAVIAYLDKRLKVLSKSEDGANIKSGEVICKIEGNMRAILTGERTSLNLLQRMCGIATEASIYASATRGKTKILDTRKTTPGLRMLEKYAVRVGGCYNHRTGLDDGILIKDNHIRGVGSIRQAVESAKKNVHHLLEVEVEVSNLDDLSEAIEAEADGVLLDNMSDDMIEKAVKKAKSRLFIEVSGGITLERITKLSNLGVDYISVGALTHSVKSADISLELEKI
jgi:nicotinate-nucleotide pyrophosphorylase (carboxylating)